MHYPAAVTRNTCRAQRRFLLPVMLLALLVLGGCASTSKITSGEGGASIAQAQGVAYNGPKARIAVGKIIDKSGDAGKRSLDYQLGLMNRTAGGGIPDPTRLTSGIQDMLTTALFNSNRFIVLERANIKDVLVEQDFSTSGRVGDESHIPMSQIEGVELLVVGAITGFDAGVGGGALPIPIPIGRNGDFATLNLSFKRGFISMDLRVIDTKTARVVSTIAVEGNASKFGAAVAGYARSSRHGGYIRLPVVLSGFENTPVEKAINKMVDAAVDFLVTKTPEVYFHDQDQPVGKKGG
jgi:curli biogenesis system outer membrane secretion channel CsgG